MQQSVGPGGAGMVTVVMLLLLLLLLLCGWLEMVVDGVCGGVTLVELEEEEEEEEEEDEDEVEEGRFGGPRE